MLGERIRTNDASPEVRPAVDMRVLQCMRCHSARYALAPTTHSRLRWLCQISNNRILYVHKIRLSVDDNPSGR